MGGFLRFFRDLFFYIFWGFLRFLWILGRFLLTFKCPYNNRPDNSPSSFLEKRVYDLPLPRVRSWSSKCPSNRDWSSNFAYTDAVDSHTASRKNRSDLMRNSNWTFPNSDEPCSAWSGSRGFAYAIWCSDSNEILTKKKVKQNQIVGQHHHKESSHIYLI